MIGLNVALMGAVAGFTIFLGLPLARIPGAGARLRGFLNSLAIGILFFLFVEVTEHSWQPVEESVRDAVTAGAPAGPAAAFFALFAGGVSFGLLSLVAFEHRFARVPAAPNGGAQVPPSGLAPQRLALMIAVGIGLHNFSEGLAIGASAATGALTFAVVLAVGFALHNATEGFGIAAPLAGSAPPWRFLGALGLVGGGPTFLGTLVGALVESEYLSVLFLALAAGALLYVIRQLFIAGRAALADPKNAMVIMAGLVFGLVLGFGTELAVEIALPLGA